MLWLSVPPYELNFFLSIDETNVQARDSTRENSVWGSP